MKLNRKLSLILAVVLSLAMAVGSTMAYLQDTDEDVNVMTLGNVYINQLEYERVPTEGHEMTNDAWESTGEEDKYGYTPDEVRPFTQAKPLYPAVFADGIIKWDERVGSNGDPHQQSWADVKGEKTTGAPGSFQLFDESVKNVIDKFVFVENTGKSDAYVRTWFAFEQGSVAAEDFSNVIMTNTDKDHWEWETVATDVEIDGNKYVVKVATYKGPTSNPTGILAPGAISYVSLAQVYMKPEATNDDVIAIDGNKNGTYDILVLSQAVQAQGFADATSALNAAFKEPTVENIPWDAIEFPYMIMNYDDKKKAFSAGGSYIIGDDIEMTTITGAKDGKEVTIDLNNHTITTLDKGQFTLGAQNGGKITINGEGTYEMAKGFMTNKGNAHITVNGGTYYMTATGSTNATGKYHSIIQNTSGMTINDGKFISSEDDSVLFLATSNGTLEINGGFFASEKSGEVDLLDVGRSGSSVNRVIIRGGTFVNYDLTSDPYYCSLDDRGVTYDALGGPWIVIPNGYEVVSETQENGDVWYTVVKK